MRRVARRSLLMGVFWWLTMTYPVQEGVTALVIALTIGTIGFVGAISYAYLMGRSDAVGDNR